VKNVNKKLLYILCSVMCMCFMFGFTTTTAHAQDNVYLTKDFEMGDTYYYHCENYAQNGVASGDYYIADYECVKTNDNKLALCIVGGSSVSGYRYQILGQAPGDYNMSIKYQNVTTGELSEITGYQPFDFQPYPYGNNFTIDFYTNIPIFENSEDAVSYINGTLGIENAQNYKKVYENGSWVAPFEDIEINDSDILVPQLSNISHNGFTVNNCNDERYMIEIYLTSGIQNFNKFDSGSLSLDDSMYITTFGMITDNSEAYYNGPVFDIAQMYGIDNYSSLYNSICSFFSDYPCYMEWKTKVNGSVVGDAKRESFYAVWAKPFGKSYYLMTAYTSPNSVDLENVSVDNFPLCYTNYKVRYFYYDDTSGFHYGPWANVTYFSDGRVSNNSIFQSNTGNIMETPIINGVQGETGNITYSDNTNYIDLNNPNNFFGYIRSLLNNVSATMNSYSTLFSLFFSFIPSDLQGAIWLGIAIMLVTGVILAIIKS